MFRSATIRRALILGATVLQALHFAATSVLAQPAQPATEEPIGRNYVGDAILVVLLFAAALFAVCRTSHRN